MHQNIFLNKGNDAEKRKKKRQAAKFLCCGHLFLESKKRAKTSHFYHTLHPGAPHLEDFASGGKKVPHPTTAARPHPAGYTRRRGSIFKHQSVPKVQNIFFILFFFR